MVEIARKLKENPELYFSSFAGYLVV